MSKNDEITLNKLLSTFLSQKYNSNFAEATFRRCFNVFLKVN